MTTKHTVMSTAGRLKTVRGFRTDPNLLQSVDGLTYYIIDESGMGRGGRISVSLPGTKTKIELEKLANSF